LSSRWITKKITVDIPPGVSDGAKRRFHLELPEGEEVDFFAVIGIRAEVDTDIY
jgi:hypothetical protein